MAEKKPYEKVEVEVIGFEGEDVIVTSSTGGGTTLPPR